MKVVVLSGPESAGKSTLCQALAERDTGYADISLIAEQQLARELAARAQQPDLLLLDTHLLSNKLWSETLFGRSPDWIESALKAQHYDLTISSTLSALVAAASAAGIALRGFMASTLSRT